MHSRRSFLILTGATLASSLATPSIIKNAYSFSANERRPSRFDFAEPLEQLSPQNQKGDRLQNHAQLLKQRFGGQDVPIEEILTKNKPKDVQLDGTILEFASNARPANPSKIVTDIEPSQIKQRTWENPTPDDMRYLLKNSPRLKNNLASIRAIWIRNPHTKEELRCVFWNNGVYDNDAYAKVCILMQDWREKIVMAMDPLLMHIIWRIQSDVNYDAPVNINSAYRTKKTNDMLAKEGAAQNSQHLNARAIDIGVPGYSPRAVGERAMELGVGGVGFYKTFTHVDTGNKRYW